jgi:mannose-6-phosphate isomerase-like protein (cupin superfamily)
MTRRIALGYALFLMLMAAVSHAPVRAADPVAPVHWKASDIAALERRISSEVDPARHLGLERLLESATLIYRDGPSEAEIHETLADFITVREGEGEVLVGGTILDPRRSAPGELRGAGISGGTRYGFAAGDMLYIPSNTVHQFFVTSGRSFIVTIVKITPR